jgi:hypothetical protein
MLRGRGRNETKRNRPEADIGYWRRSEYLRVRRKHTDYHQSVSRVESKQFRLILSWPGTRTGPHCSYWARYHCLGPGQTVRKCPLQGGSRSMTRSPAAQTCSRSARSILRLIMGRQTKNDLGSQDSCQIKACRTLSSSYLQAYGLRAAL